MLHELWNFVLLCAAISALFSPMILAVGYLVVSERRPKRWRQARRHTGR